MIRWLALLLSLTLTPLAWAIDQSPHCRVSAHAGMSASCGSGTLIDDDTVVTCSHIFDDQFSEITCAFPNGRRYQARIVNRDRQHDLCTLQISPAADFQHAEVAERGTRPRSITVCGYGSGSFRSASGPIHSSEAIPGAEYQHLVANVAVRSGDSGGGVLDEQGQLTGVIWGCADGQVRFFGGEPLWRIVEQTQCYDGVCRPSRPCDCAAKWVSLNTKLEIIAKLEARIADLEGANADLLTQIALLKSNANTVIDQRIGNYFTQNPVHIPEAPSADEITKSVLAQLDRETPIRVYLPSGRLVGESRTNIFQGGSIDLTFNPRALLDSTAGER